MPINRKGRNESSMNFGRWNVSTRTESIATHMSESIKTLLVQHTSAPTQPTESPRKASTTKPSLKTKPPPQARSASVFTSAMAGLPSLPKGSTDN